MRWLYPPERLKEIPLSTSSRWWRCSPFGFVDPNQQAEIYVFEQFGGTFTFKLENGSRQIPEGAGAADPGFAGNHLQFKLVEHSIRAISDEKHNVPTEIALPIASASWYVS